MNIYLIQPSFAAGEISPYVANRVDLDKYKSALLTAQNLVIRPFGGCYRRQGSEFIGKVKYDDKPTVLVAFNAGIDDAYLLEVGYQYIRIWEDGKYTKTELSTPYNNVDNLQFTQSADTMFICSGDYPIQYLQRTATGWTFKEYEITEPYYDSATQAVNKETSFTTPGEYTFTPQITGKYTVEIIGAGGGGAGTGVQHYSYTYGGDGQTATGTIELQGGNGGSGEKKIIIDTLTAGQTYSVTVGAGGKGGKSQYSRRGDAQPTGGTDGGKSSFNNVEAKGGGGGIASKPNGQNQSTKGKDGTPYQGGAKGGVSGVCKDIQRNPSQITDGKDGQNGYVRITFSGNNELKPSATSGNDVIITATKDTFTPGMVNSHIKLTQQAENQSERIEIQASSITEETKSIRAGKAWKITTHGTWKGKVTVYHSDDNKTWQEYRSYKSNNDQNFTESGTVTTPTWMKAVAVTDADNGSGKLTVDFSRNPYSNDGTAKITEVVSPTEVKASVITDFANTDKTQVYALSSWNDDNGYPKMACFFQDRLVLAATKKEPYSIWMSRTGDYPNFGIEKVDGGATDDSAIKADLITRNGFEILHLVPAKDLVILTTGNEWIIEGASVITPAKINPRPQTMRGSNTCHPQHIGNRIVHVQRSGKTVRDLGYQYDADNYNGDDLTLLATHLTEGHKLVSSAYIQEPNSTLYYVRDDGVLLSLAFIKEQNVFAWSHHTTDGKYKKVASIPNGASDVLYVTVERDGKTYIERFNPNLEAAVYMDSYVTGSGSSIEIPHLIGKTVQVLADGTRLQDAVVPENGLVTFGQSFSDITIGLAYETRVEQPGPDIGLKEGTMQARISKINTVVLRVEKSYGGHIGYTFKDKDMDELRYEDYETLETGDIVQQMPVANIGSNTKNHICIKHDEPFPFELNAIIREISIDGGIVKSYNGEI
nr:MAG TPA: stabilization protein [Caudoviricetes sp.]